MVRSSEECSLRFRSLVDKLYVLKKIRAPCADNAKGQFDKFLTAVKYEHKEIFTDFKFKEDHLDKFLDLYVVGEDQFKDFWCVCKLVFILSHGQSNVERGFSVNKEVLQHNLEHKSLVLQRIIYDTLQSNGSKLQDFTVTQNLPKNCKLAYQKCKLDLEQGKKRKGRVALNLKERFDEIESVKAKK